MKKPGRRGNVALRHVELTYVSGTSPGAKPVRLTWLSPLSAG